MGRPLLREYVRILVEGRRKKLYIFDFDDTLVKTGSMIHVTGGDGRRFSLTPGEFAVYEAGPGDRFDFSDFSKLIAPKEIKWTVRILRSILASGQEAVILTARSAEAPVHQFLEEAGLPSMRVIALADGNPQRKADYVAARLDRGDVEEVEFFDDSYKNVAAVKALASSYPRVRIVTRHVVHRTEIS